MGTVPSFIVPGDVNGAVCTRAQSYDTKCYTQLYSAVLIYPASSPPPPNQIPQILLRLEPLLSNTQTSCLPLVLAATKGLPQVVSMSTNKMDVTAPDFTSPPWVLVPGVANFRDIGGYGLSIGNGSVGPPLSISLLVPPTLLSSFSQTSILNPSLPKLIIQTFAGAQEPCFPRC